MHILSDDYPLKSYPTFSDSIDQLLPFFLVLCCSMSRLVSLLIGSSQCKFGGLFSFRWICQASLLSLVKQIASQWAIVWWFFPCDISALMRSKTSLLVTIAVSCILKSLLQHHHCINALSIFFFFQSFYQCPAFTSTHWYDNGIQIWYMHSIALWCNVIGFAMKIVKTGRRWKINKQTMQFPLKVQYQYQLFWLLTSGLNLLSASFWCLQREQK